jgi:hypothetical protein
MYICVYITVLQQVKKQLSIFWYQRVVKLFLIMRLRGQTEDIPILPFSAINGKPSTLHLVTFMQTFVQAPTMSFWMASTNVDQQNP